MAHDERTEWTADTVVVRGVVHSNLYDALDAGAAGFLPERHARRARLGRLPTRTNTAST